MRPEQNGWKLIRHKMPANAEKPMIVREVVGDEHLQFLQWKLEEEADELATATTAQEFIKEMADVQQALSDLCAVTDIKIGRLQLPALDRVPTIDAEQKPFLRAQVDRVVTLAYGMPDDELDRVQHVATIAAVLKVIRDIAGIREHVTKEMARKFEERGGFNPGVIWKVVEKAS